jgi:hypothetical protein
MPKFMLKIVTKFVLFVLFVPANKLASSVSEWNFRMPLFGKPSQSF